MNIGVLDRRSKKLYAWETSPVNDIAMVLLCGEMETKVSLQSMQPHVDILCLHFVARRRLCLHRPEITIQSIPQSQHSAQTPPRPIGQSARKAISRQSAHRVADALVRYCADDLGQGQSESGRTIYTGRWLITHVVLYITKSVSHSI